MVNAMLSRSGTITSNRSRRVDARARPGDDAAEQRCEERQPARDHITAPALAWSASAPRLGGVMRRVHDVLRDVKKEAQERTHRQRSEDSQQAHRIRRCVRCRRDGQQRRPKISPEPRYSACSKAWTIGCSNAAS